MGHVLGGCAVWFLGNSRLVPKSVSRPRTLRKLSLYAVSKAPLPAYPRCSFQLHCQKPDVLGLGMMEVHQALNA